MLEDSDLESHRSVIATHGTSRALGAINDFFLVVVNIGEDIAGEKSSPESREDRLNLVLSVEGDSHKGSH